MYDVAIIGGGIVGLAVGLTLLEQQPAIKLVILEKEGQWAYHQTGHNSGVIHSGIYYKPGSLKARFAQAGSRAMVEFCQVHGIRYELCGKVIVATDAAELPRLQNLYQRGLANGLAITMLNGDELREIEPHVRGVAAIHVPQAGIVDYKQVAATFARLIAEHGGDLRLNTKVERIEEQGNKTVVYTSTGPVETTYIVNCAGLHSDRVAKLGAVQTNMRIVPFRGEYYELKPEKRYLVKHLVYPVPNPDFPFLGVHFTRMIDGQVHAGPNAVLGLKREAYKKTDFDLRDAVDVLTYPAFWKLAAKHGAEGAKEIIRSLSKRAFVRSLQKLIPEVQGQDLVPSQAGVRAQALMHDGKLMDDFVIVEAPRALHVCNAPSPAATASLAIANSIVERVPIVPVLR